MIDPSLPGADLIDRGIRDVEAGRSSVEALVVSIGAPRLRRLGIPVRNTIDDPEHRLWHLLARDGEDGAHARYNALIRRLVSFEDALACVA